MLPPTNEATLRGGAVAFPPLQQSQQQSSSQQQQPPMAAAREGAAVPPPFANLLSQQQRPRAPLLQPRAAPAAPPAVPASDLGRLIDRKSRKAGATEASLSKVRAERASLASKLAALSAAPLHQAWARLAAARALFEEASAAKTCLKLELDTKQAQTDELRALSVGIAARREAAGKALRAEAEAHAAAMTAALAEVEGATKKVGGAFLADA